MCQGSSEGFMYETDVCLGEEDDGTMFSCTEDNGTWMIHRSECDDPKPAMAYSESPACNADDENPGKYTKITCVSEDMFHMDNVAMRHVPWTVLEP
eukprot:UN20536